MVMERVPLNMLLRLWYLASFDHWAHQDSINIKRAVAWYHYSAKIHIWAIAT